ERCVGPHGPARRRANGGVHFPRCRSPAAAETAAPSQETECVGPPRPTEGPRRQEARRESVEAAGIPSGQSGSEQYRTSNGKPDLPGHGNCRKCEPAGEGPLPMESRPPRAIFDKNFAKFLCLSSFEQK